MSRTAAILISVAGFALSASAQDKAPQLPENSINCKQFRKTASDEWTEVGTAVFDLGSVKDINLSDQPVRPRYFKFGGVDLYPVLEQKCGAVAYYNRANASQAKGDYGGAIADYNAALRIDPKLAGAPIQRAFALGQLVSRPQPNVAAEAPITPITLDKGAAIPKIGSEPDKSASISVETPTQKQAKTPAQVIMSETVPISEKVAQTQPEKSSCGDKKSVYVADGLTDSEGVKALVEIAFTNKTAEGNKADRNSEFVIREYRNAKLEWSYKGKTIQDKFIFTPMRPSHVTRWRSFMFASTPVNRQKPIVLALSYVKPKRDGSGEEILYLNGLRALFASKENVYRFKFEGKRPGGLLPEAFYFDRCE